VDVHWKKNWESIGYKKILVEGFQGQAKKEIITSMQNAKEFAFSYKSDICHCGLLELKRNTV